MQINSDDDGFKPTGQFQVGIFKLESSLSKIELFEINIIRNRVYPKFLKTIPYFQHSPSELFLNPS